MNPAFFSIFGLLEKKQLENLSKRFETVQLDPDTHLYQQLDYADHIYGLVDGMIKIGINLEDQKTMVKRLVSPGQFFGFAGIIGQQQHHEFAQTLNGASSVLVAPVRAIREVMQENEQFLFAVMEMVGRHLQQAESRLEVLLTGDVRSRIMHFLKEHIKEKNTPDQIETLLRYGLTQQDIAQMIGATRQTVAIILNEMRKENLIDFSRKKFVLKPKMLSL